MTRRRPLALFKEGNPIASLQGEINELFDDLWKGWRLPNSWRRWSDETFAPEVDVNETDKAITVKLDLPGMDEKDVNVELAYGVLTIRGEKRDEREETKGARHISERTYGSFMRSLRLPSSVDADAISATVAKGEMTITLPKTAEARTSARKIPISSRK